MEIFRPRGVMPIEAVEPTDELLKDCEFIGTCCHSDTMQNVRLYKHVPTGRVLWV
jgi:hypothetical protein